jgi:hypothetical protein
VIGGKRTALIVVASATVLCACGTTPTTNSDPPRSTSSTLARGDATLVGTRASEAAQHRLTELVLRAQAIYARETNGARVHSDLRLMAGDEVLLNDLAGGDPVAGQAEAQYKMMSNAIDHITRVSVIRGSRVLVNAVWNHNGSFVVAPLVRPLYYHGRSLGTLLVSVQDVVGYVKLIHALTGAWAVVRGSSGQARTSLPAAADVSLPRSGLSTIAGRLYAVSSFTVGGWQAEALTVWILVPV